MAGGGLFDYLRAISNVVRGLIVNLLVGLPYLLLAALGVAAMSISGWGFGLATVLVVVAVAWILVSPIALRLWQIGRLQTATHGRSGSSIVVRDRFEGGLGLLLLLVVAAATCEALSYFLDDFHFWTQERGLTLSDLIPAGTAVLGVFGVAARAVGNLSGLKKTVVGVVVGVLGVLVPLITVMFIADYLVFRGPGARELDLVVGAAWVLTAALGVALVVGVATRAFRGGVVAIAVIGIVGAVLALLLAVPRVRDTLLDQDDVDRQLALLDIAETGGFDGPEFLERTGSASEEVARKAEIERLAGRMASRPPDALTELIRLLDLSVVGVENQRAGMQNGQPERALADLSEDTYGLGADQVLEIRQAEFFWGRGQLPGVPVLIDELREAHANGFMSADDRFVVAGELGLLYAFRLQTIVPLIEAHPSGAPTLVVTVANRYTDETINQLVYPLDETETFEFPSQDAGGLGPLSGTWDACGKFVSASDPTTFEFPLAVDGPDLIRGPFVEQYPGLQHYSDFGLGFLNDDLCAIAGHLREIRTELAREAVFSSQYPLLRGSDAATDIRWQTFRSGAVFILLLAAILFAYGWLAIDPNRNSFLSLYRDRLASTFLIGPDPNHPDRVTPEPDIDVSDLCNYHAGSIAPFHLINCAVNLPASKDISIHDRRSDYFIFSPLFIGSKVTGYCRTQDMERVFPEMSVSTAMAISAAAAAPNMGRMTQRGYVAAMVLLNIRMGSWVPNPGRLDERNRDDSNRPLRANGYSLEQVIEAEHVELQKRWQQLAGDDGERSVEGGLFGLAFSGGGIRSASLNLGLVQALHRAGVFEHVDYLSTVSGGGYVGSSISVSMRTPEAAGDDGDAGERTPSRRRTFSDLFLWRATPNMLLREFTGRMHERTRSVNVSDGGHIENLATIELLRRECRWIIVGDAEMDSMHRFGGLTMLIRTARIELDAEIDIDLDALRLDEDGCCSRSWAVGEIAYRSGASGYLLYFKSSATHELPPDIQGYRARNPLFPHEPTSDQFFDEGQFESYRNLGYHMAQDALRRLPARAERERSFRDIEHWFEVLHGDQARASHRSDQLPDAT